MPERDDDFKAEDSQDQGFDESRVDDSASAAPDLKGDSEERSPRDGNTNVTDNPAGESLLHDDSHDFDSGDPDENARMKARIAEAFQIWESRIPLGAVRLARFFQRPDLPKRLGRELDLDNWGIGDVGVMYLVVGTRRLTELRKVCLSRNRITDRALVPLTIIIEKAKKAFSFCEEFDLSYNFITSIGLCLFLETADLPALERLRIAGNQLDKYALAVLLRYRRNFPKLNVIDISFNTISKKYVDWFSQEVKGCRVVYTDDPAAQAGAAAGLSQEMLEAKALGEARDQASESDSSESAQEIIYDPDAPDAPREEVPPSPKNFYSEVGMERTFRKLRRVYKDILKQIWKLYGPDFDRKD
jgi:hypothetical protein